MRKLKLVVYFSLAVMTGSVVAAQITIDEDYMQTMEDRQKSLTSNLSLKDAKSAGEDIKELEDMFTDVETYYEQKGNAADAVNWSKDSKDLAATIEKYVAANDFDTAAETAVTLAKTCKACHKIYKKKDK